MNRKVLVFALTLMFLTTMMWANGASEQDKGKEDNVVVVGLAWNERMQSLVQAWEDYMMMYSKEYGDENGLTFKWIANVSDSDPIQQASNIDDLIAQNVDIIVARPHDAAAIGASIRAAHDAGIKFVTFDRSSEGIKPDAHVGADSYNQAISTAEYFAELLTENGVEGKVIELMGDLRDVNAILRSKGWHEVEDRTDAWETIVQVPTEWNPEKFRSGTANALEAYPEANAMFIASDFAFSAVQSALEAADRFYPVGHPKHVWIATQDVNPQGYDGMKGGYIDVATTYDAYFHAVELVEVVGRLFEGEDLGGESFLVAGRVATPDNVDKLENMWAIEYTE